VSEKLVSENKEKRNYTHHSNNRKERIRLMDIVSVCHEITCNKGKLFNEIREVFRFSQCNELKIHILLIKNMCMNLGIFNTLVVMHKINQVQILTIVPALPTLIFANGLQQQ
jgi:hypothetical protein